MLETDVLHIAIESLEKLTKARMVVRKHHTLIDGYEWDALIDLQVGIATIHFKVEIKNNVLPANLTNLAEILVKEKGLLVARYISAPAKTLLEQMGINYLDIAGNCFIQDERGIFLHIKGESLPETFRENKHKAFNKNGIKLIYALLLKEGLINAPYRTIAEMAGISSSTIGSVQEDLTASKYLYPLNENKKLLHNKARLLEDWVTAFNQKLRPTLFRERYRFANGAEGWRNLDLGTTAYWAGEPAAALLTNYLQPGIWTIYTNVDRKILIRDFQLVPDPRQGNVDVYSIFWNEQNATFINQNLKIVHPLLVYADLINSDNDRNFATAKKIYAQHLRNIVE